MNIPGDAYLKYLSSIYLFVTNPSQHEGALHSARLRIISNKALLQNGDSAGLPPFIQAKNFVSKFWRPPSFEVYAQPSLAPIGNIKSEAEGDVDAYVVADRDAVAAGCEDTLAVPVAITLVKEEDSASASVLDRLQRNEPSIVRRERMSVDTTKDPLPTASSSVKADKEQSGDSKDPGREFPGTKQKRLQDEQGIHWLGDKV